MTIKKTKYQLSINKWNSEYQTGISTTEIITSEKTVLCCMGDFLKSSVFNVLTWSNEDARVFSITNIMGGKITWYLLATINYIFPFL